MQPLAIYHLRNLLCSHPSVLAREAIKYGFFNFHTSKLLIIPKQKVKKPKLFLSYIVAVFVLLLDTLSVDVGQIVIGVGFPLVRLELGNHLLTVVGVVAVVAQANRSVRKPIITANYILISY